MVHSSLSLSEHCPGAKFAFGREREREREREGAGRRSCRMLIIVQKLGWTHYNVIYARVLLRTKYYWRRGAEGPGLPSKQTLV